MTPTFRSIQPSRDEFAPHYAVYIAAVPPADILDTLAGQRKDAHDLLSGLSEAQAMSSYAPGKWNIKEVIGHVIDGERIFAYRALRIARGDKTPLASFAENDYVPTGRFGIRTVPDLVSEFDHVRVASIDLLAHLDEEAWLRRGTASTYEVSVRALAWIIAGHAQHHLGILRERYLSR